MYFKWIKTTIVLTFGVLAIAQSAHANGITIAAGASLVANGSPTIATNGDWDNNGTFTAATSTVILNGTTSTTLEAGGSSFNNLTINKTAAADADDNVTIQTDALTVTGTTTVTDGELVQGATNLTLAGITIAAAGAYTNESTGNLTLSDAVANAGTITFDASGGGGGDADAIVIRSSVADTARNWQGAGTFTMTDVDVKDQTAIGGTPAFIFVTSGTDSDAGGNTNWIFGGGALTSLDVVPASLAAGAEGDVTVEFTTANAWPADGILVIDFGSGFNAAGLTTITNVSGIDGGFTVALSNGDGTNDVVTLTRDAVGTQVAASTAVSIRLEDEVKNPAVTGSTGVYTLTTQLSDSTAIDSGTAAADTITAGVLSAISVTPDALFAGALGNVTVAFTTVNDLPLDGKITIEFPAGFDLTGVTTATSAADLDGTLTVSVAGQIVTITRGGGSSLTGGNTVDDLILDNVRNPKSVGTTGTFTVSTTTSLDVTIDTGTGSGVQISANDGLIFLRVTASPQRVRIGQVVTYRAEIENLTTTSLADFDYVQQLPPGLVFRSGSVSIDGGEIASTGMGTSIRFKEFSALAAGQTRTMTFQVFVGSNATSGTFSNPAFIEINPVISNSVQVVIEIIPDFVFQLGTLIGKVFWDKNADGRQQNGEPGLPDIQVATEEGIRITTDKYGRYNVPDMTVGRHAVKIDVHTLPTGATLTTQKSVWIETTEAMMNKVNFGIQIPEDDPLAVQTQLPAGEEPINVSVRVDSNPPAPHLALDFNLFSTEPSRMPLPGDSRTDWVMPLNPQTNFPSFIKRWDIRLFEFKAGESEEEDAEIQIAAQSGSGTPPSFVGLKVDIEQLFGSKHELRIVFDAYDTKNHKASAAYGLYVKADAEGAEVYLSSLTSTKEQTSELKLSGSEVTLEGESPNTHRIEIFGQPVAVSSEGRFSASFVLPEGVHEIPIDVYPGGFNPITGEIKIVEPIHMTRRIKASDNYLFYVGFGELEFGHVGFDGAKTSLSPIARDRQEKNMYQDHRLAYYAKGKMLGKYYLTASIDTDRENRDIFRYLEPEDFYSTYGDDSQIQYDATDTQDEVFVMLEADKSYFRYGNYGTGLTGTEFSDFERSMHGYKAHYESKEAGTDDKSKTVLTGFYAQGRQLAARVEFAATGGSLYYLKHKDVSSGSDKVKVEVRDSLTGITVQEMPLVSGQDYQIDYNQGRIRLHKPLLSYDYISQQVLSTGLLDGNPQFLIADYEFDAGSIAKDKTTGLRLTREWLPGIRLGGTYVEEKRQLENYQLTGLDASVHLFDRLKIVGETASSDVESVRHFISNDGGLNFQKSETAGPGTKGGGFKVELFSDPWSGASVNSYYRTLDRDFSSTGSLSDAGILKFGVDFEQLFGQWGRFRALHHEEELLEGGTIGSEKTGAEEVRLTEVQFDVQREKWKGQAAYRRTLTEGEFVDLFDDERVDHEREDLLGAKVSYEITEKTMARMTGQTNLTGEPNSQLKTELIHELNPATALTAMHIVGSRGNGLLFGIDRDLFGQRHSFGKGFGLLRSSGPSDALSNGFASVRDSMFQDTTLGFKRRVGTDTEALVTQTVGASGLGTRVLSISTQKENRSFLLQDQTTGDDKTTVISHESKIGKNVSSYGSATWQRPKHQEGDEDKGTFTTVKGTRISLGEEGRFSLYGEDENSLFQGSRRLAKRVGTGLMITPALTVNMSYQKDQSQTSDEDIASHVGKLAIDYNKFGIGRTSHEFEFRSDDAAEDYTQFMAAGQGDLKLGTDWSLMGRYEWSQTKEQVMNSKSGRFSEYQIGTAYRPVKTDWINALAEFKWVDDKSILGQDDINAVASEGSQVLRAETTIEATRFFTITEKVAARREKLLSRVAGSQDLKSTTLFWGNRLTAHVHDRVDVSGEFQMLSQSMAEDVRYGLLLETSVKIVDPVRVAVGYNMAEFDSDLVSALDVDTKTFYVRVFLDAIEGAEKILQMKRKDRKTLAQAMMKRIQQLPWLQKEDPLLPSKMEERKEIKASYERAQALLDQGEYEKAIDELEDGLKIYESAVKFKGREKERKHRFDFYYEQGKAFYDNGYLVKALENFEKAAGIYPDFQGLEELMNHLQREVRRKKMSERQIRKEKAVQLKRLKTISDPGELLFQTVQMHYTIGKKYLDTGFTEEAIEEWQAAFELVQRYEMDQSILVVERKKMLEDLESVQAKARALIEKGKYREAREQVMEGMDHFESV